MEILFISNGSIGDAIISTGILAKLMDDYPEANFTVAVGPPAVPLFKDCPRITQTISMFKLPYHQHWWQLWQQTNKITWDLIVDLRSSIMAYILNAHHRRVLKKPDKSLSKAEQLAKLMDVSPPPPPRLWIADETRAIARNLLLKDKKAVILAPKTNSIFKDWPIDRFTELARRLHKDDIIFVILASGLQHQSLQPLLRALPSEWMIDLAGKTDLPTAYGVIEQAKLFIGNDSGLLHMAAAAKTPSVGIYGPSNDKTYAPVSENLRIVKAHEFQMGEEEKREAGWIEKVTVDEVEAAVRGLNVL